MVFRIMLKWWADDGENDYAQSFAVADQGASMIGLPLYAQKSDLEALRTPPLFVSLASSLSSAEKRGEPAKQLKTKTPGDLHRCMDQTARLGLPLFDQRSDLKHCHTN